MRTICHVSTMHPTFDTRVFKKECVSLAKNGYEIILVIPHSKEEVVDGVRIVPLRKHNTFLERIYKSPKRAIRLLKDIDADIYHFHDPELVPYMASFAQKYNKKVIWDAHENYKDTIKSFNSFKIKPLSLIASFLFNFFELRFAKKHFAGVVTITERMAQKYQEKGIRTCVLNNYADTSKFKYNGQEDLSPNPRLISAGGQFEARAVEEIAYSLKEIKKTIPNVELYITGKFSTKEFEEKVASILYNIDNSQESFKIEGLVPFDYMINTAIPQAWVSVILFDISDPNNRNSMTNRFFESWANGVPIITTKGTLTAEIIKKINGGIIIDDNDPTSIAAAFVKIVSDKNYRNELGQNGYNAVKGQYNWDTNFKDLLTFYEEIL